MIKIDTKLLLANSLKELVRRTPFESISVKDISNNCGASRTAFYNHFQDKYDLVCWIYRTDSEEICNGFDCDTWRVYHTRLLEYMKKEKDFYISVSLYEGQNCILDYITFYTTRCLERIIKRKLKTNALEEHIEMSLNMWSIARTKMVFQWLRTNDTKSAENMTNLLCDCIPEPISNLLE